MQDQRPGLRERKKLATRLRISDVATRLFIRRGFDNVSIAEVAEAAEVSVNTIFNYFVTKEELFFDQGAEVAAASARTVRERRPDESPLDAIERTTLALLDGKDDRLFRASVRGFARTIENSPALKARARLLFDDSEAQLASALRDSGLKDEPARVTAALVSSVYWLLVRELAARLLAGDEPAATRKALRALATVGFRQLRQGIH